MNKIDRRQFIIMDKPYEHQYFNFVDLKCGLILSYHNDLNIVKSVDGILLGWAFDCSGKKVEDISNAVEKMHRWAGRWILLTETAIFTDTCATLGVYYDLKNRIISSSLHLIETVTGKKWKADYVAERGRGGILDYYPIPYTPVRDVMKMLPSQYMDYDCVCHFRSDYMIPRYKNKTITELQQMFIDGMSGVMKSIALMFHDNVWITLTSGYDSRTNLAVAHYSGITYRTYTSKRPDTPDFEIRRAKKIAKKMSVEHMILDECGAPDAKRGIEFDEHCGGHITFGTERSQYMLGTDVPQSDGSVVLWGTLWAMTFKTYQNFMIDYETIDDCFGEIAKYSGNTLEKSSIHKKSILSWLQFVFDYPIDDMDWRQRLYWEQRNGAWVSAAQQGLDMLDSIRIAPINCQYLIEILLSYPDEYQHSKEKQKMIIDTCCPQIKGIAYGKQQGIPEKIVRKARKGVMTIMHKLNDWKVRGG